MHIRRKPKPKGVIRASGGLQDALGTHIRSFMRDGKLHLRNADGSHALDKPLRIHGARELCWSDRDLWDVLPDEGCEVIWDGDAFEVML